jgi:uncharacterized membrane protein HdeD (DUF308 family)
MTMNDAQALAVQVPDEIIRHWGWYLAFGFGLVLLGVIAIARSVTATVVSMLFFGWLLAMASGIEIVQALMVGKWAGFFQHLLAAILFGVTGLLFIARPLAGAEVVTVLMASFFLIGGFFQLFGSWLVSLPGYGWHALDGVISIILGVLVLAQWPASGLWVIGTFVGINLIFYGGAWIAFALSARSG